MTVNVSDFLREAAANDPDGTALVEHRGERHHLSWSDLDSAADAIARALSGRGLLAHQRVAIVMANRIDLPIAYFGILRGGMVAVPMNPRSTTREIGRMLDDAKVKVVLCDEAGATQVREALQHERAPSDCSVVVDGIEPLAGETRFSDFLADAPQAEPAAPRDSEALAVILYTSGTSGKPRGVMLTHRALVANIEQTAAIDPPPVTSEDVCLGLLPMFHIYGLNAVLGQAVRQGACTLMVDGFDPAGLLDTIATEGVTNLPLAPPVIAAWAGRDDLREKLAGVNLVLSGASTLDPELAGTFFESSGHHVEQGYGLTETAPVIATTLGSPGARTTRPSPARSDARSRASRSASSTRAATTPHPETQRSCGCVATTSSPATGPTAWTVRTRTAGTRQATSAWSTPTATSRSSTASVSSSSSRASTSIRSRSRTSSPRWTAWPRPRLSATRTRRPVKPCSPSSCRREGVDQDGRSELR